MDTITVTWVLIGFADLFSILAGLYCAFQVYRYYSEGRDMWKAQKFFLAAGFLLIALPWITTTIGLWVMPYMAQVLPLEITLATTSGYTNAEPMSADYGVNLYVRNDQNTELVLDIDTTCELVSGASCSDIEIILPKRELIFDPWTTIDIPVTIITDKDVRATRLNFTLRHKDGSIYDQGKLTLKKPQ